MKKKSTLTNKLHPTDPKKIAPTGNMQPNASLSIPSSLVQQGYTKKKGCGCGRKES